jgi:hypothetical protein
LAPARLRQETGNFVSRPLLQSALRETQRHFVDPRVPAGLVMVALILGFAGPFGTYGELDILPRLAYWAAVVVTTYAVGYFTTQLLQDLLRSQVPHRLLRGGLVGAVTGLPVTAVVVALNLLAFGERAGTVIDVVSLWLNVTLIAIGVVAMSVLLFREANAPDAADANAKPALLDRLPLPQRAPLVSISVTDHYVEVTTEKGKALVLMRLSDAIRETPPTPGLQIHRSHWVALEAVARTVRTGDKLLVELKDGRRLPVSRSYTRDVRDAGLVV